MRGSCEGLPFGKFLAKHKEQVSKFGFFRGFPQCLRDGRTQKILETWTFPWFLAILKGQAHPRIF
jgi:hypothetical protein